MSEDYQVSADDFSAASLGTAVACAVAIAVADGQMDETEQQAIADQLCSLLGVDGERAASLVTLGLEKAASTDRESLFAEACGELEPGAREGCFVIACAVASKAKGIGASEGVALQKLAKGLEIGYPSAAYNRLLSAGMRLGRA